MADQDQDKQQAPADDGSLPGDFFMRRPKAPSDQSLPGDFFNMTPAAQQNYLRTPDALPEDLPERTLKTVARAAPFVGATGAALFAPEITLPAILGGTTGGSLLSGGIAAGLGGALGSGVQSGIYSATGDEEAPTSLLDAVKRAGIEGGVQSLNEITGRGVGKILEAALNPERLYQMGLKPPSGRGQKVIGPIVKTGVEERIPLSEKSAAKLGRRIEDVNDEIEKVILGSPSNISPQAYAKNVEARFDALRAKYGAQPTSGRQAVAAIDQAEKDFLVNHGNVKPFNKFMGMDANGKPIYKLIEPEDMTLQALRQRARPMSSIRAQEIKKAAYEEIRSKRMAQGQTVKVPGWDPDTHPGVGLEAPQEIARALREELGNVYGVNLHKLNARDGRLIELDKAIDRYLSREGNRGLWRWGTAITGGGALGSLSHFAHGDPAATAALAGVAATGLIRGALDQPYVLSKLAIAIDAARKIPGAGRVGREVLPAGARYLEYQKRKAGESEPAEEWVPSGGQPQGEVRPERQLGPSGWRPEWSQMLADASRRIGVPLPLLRVVADREGSAAAGAQRGVPANLVRSNRGAVGLMQVEPQTAGLSEKDLEDPQKNINASARELKRLLAKPEYRNKPGLVLAAYNAGEGAVKQAGYNVARMSKETRDYVRKGLKQWAELGLPAEQAEILGASF